MSRTTEGLLAVAGVELAWRRVEGCGPTVVWMGGYRSDMTGTKAQALADWAAQEGRGFLAFDWFGHGASGGDFAQATVTRWREDALAAIDGLTEGPLVLVGSSMGGWLATLAALARPQRLHGLLLIAPAPDFTSRLVEPRLDAHARETLARDGVWSDPRDGQIYYAKLLEDGARWSILPGPVEVKAPVRILQGGRDETVPWTHALEFAQAFAADDVVFTLIRDGDHRLSRPQDLERLVATVEELVA